MLPNIVHAQKGKINGTYQWDLTEFLMISEDSFKLSLDPIRAIFYGLNQKDTVLSEGKVEYEADNLIKLISKDYEWETKKKMTITESVDSCLNDSIRFAFVFPFDGKYNITMFLGNIDKAEGYVYENTKNIVTLAPQDGILTFSFTILNQTPIKFSYRNYLRTIQFRSFQNAVQNSNSNSFEISIPDLTNSYFNRYLINGEYMRMNKERNVIFWHNEQYWKFGRK
jgi:hypothetical protein